MMMTLDGDDRKSKPETKERRNNYYSMSYIYFPVRSKATEDELKVIAGLAHLKQTGYPTNLYYTDQWDDLKEGTQYSPVEQKYDIGESFILLNGSVTVEEVYPVQYKQDWVMEYLLSCENNSKLRVLNPHLP
jgi:hypothetical protein